MYFILVFDLELEYFKIKIEYLCFFGLKYYLEYTKLQTVVAGGGPLVVFLNMIRRGKLAMILSTKWFI